MKKTMIFLLLFYPIFVFNCYSYSDVNLSLKDSPDAPANVRRGTLLKRVIPCGKLTWWNSSYILRHFGARFSKSQKKRKRSDCQTRSKGDQMRNIIFSD